MNKGKLENVKLLKVLCDIDIQYYNFEGWYFEGTAIYKIKHKKYRVDFVAGEKLPFNIAYLERGIIPKNRLDNEALLVLIYGELKKYMGRQKMISFFKEKRQKEKEEEEKTKRIEKGEQISIEKYLLNK